MICDFCSNFDGKENTRFLYLAKKLKDRGHNVEIITSDFSHSKKAHFSEQPQNYPFKITMLHEPSYRKNISLKRFFSHFIWGKNVKKHLMDRKPPDVVYAAVPTLQAAYEAGKFCKRNHIKYIIDIQDLWPEAYKMVFNIPIFCDVAFLPFSCLAGRIYKAADVIFAVSDTYLNRALKVSKKNTQGHSVYIGTDLIEFDKNIKQYECYERTALRDSKPDEILIVYGGSLGDSYDIKLVIDALALIQKLDYKFVIVGSGQEENNLQQYAREKQVNAHFVGRVEYERMCAILSLCDIAVNPIKHNSAASIINKHGDYAAAGLPVINTQESEEYRFLVNEYQMGFNCNNGDVNDVANRISMLIEDSALREKMGENSRRCAEDRFDRSKTYLTFLQEIENI